MHNEFYAKYNFENERFYLGSGDYDYKIIAAFDGHDRLSVSITRNEIDTRKQKIQLLANDTLHDVMLSDFWSRDAFQSPTHKRADYAKTITSPLSVQGLTKIGTSLIESVGPFTAEFYFLKNSPSKYEIVKPISPGRRKILQQFSGIKLYRDGFKVRPYGEEGPSFDWLSLGDRATKSPAAVSHDTGSWRVRTNQLVGAVRISKDNNPNLFDMANREGLSVNDAYRTFVTILTKIIETFEADRQYIFREYTAWVKGKISALSNTAEIIEKTTRQNPPSSNDANHEKNSDEYTKDQYKQALIASQEDNRRKDEANKTMMLFSSAGVMANTFSHEISRIMSDVGSRMQHIRIAVEQIVGENGYSGDPDFNPFPIISHAEETDQLLEAWLGVIMAGVHTESFQKQEINPVEMINKIIDLWKPLLLEKKITISPLQHNGISDETRFPLSEIDLHIILNNFFLNSAWFLERATRTDRKVDITVSEESERIILTLENNGPPLDSRFANNPDQIFAAGVTSKGKDKKEGTGLGLWIVKTLVADNLGQIHVMPKKDGFGLHITFPK